MRILSITAQKPSSTGSGIYLTELVKEFAKSGCTQAVIAGVTREDQVELPEGTAWYPVLFESERRHFLSWECRMRCRIKVSGIAILRKR